MGWGKGGFGTDSVFLFVYFVGDGWIFGGVMSIVLYRR